MKRTEKTKVVKPCLALLRARGAKALKLQPGGASGIEAGTPDIIACYRGRMLAVECKAPGERATLIQLARLREWEQAGAACAVVTSADDLLAFLKALRPGGIVGLVEDMTVVP